MKRFTPLVLAVVLAAACTDKPDEKSTTTAPLRPRLTMASLPSNASTICVAAVKERDQLLAPGGDGLGSKQARLGALDALVEDTCY